MNDNSIKKDETYAVFRKEAIVVGRSTIIIAMLLTFAPAIYLSVFHNLFPGIDLILVAFLPMLVAFVAIQIIEPLIYFPVVGLTGTYVSWLAGNILNLRIPCSVVAREVVGVKEGTPEGDIISTLGLCASVPVNLVILGVVAIVGARILDALPPNIVGMFDYLLPAILGGLFPLVLKNYKILIIGISITIITLLVPPPLGFDTAIIIAGTILIAYFLHHKKII